MRRLRVLLAVAWLTLLPALYFWPTWDRSPIGTGQPDWTSGGLPRADLLSDVAAAVVVLLAAVGAGALPAALLAPRIKGLTRGLVVLALGSGILGALGLVLGALGWMRPRPLAATAYILAGAGLTVVVVRLARHRQPLAVPRPSPAEFLAWGLLGLAGAFALVGALAPEIEYDAVWYHLGFPAFWLVDGSVTDFPCQYVTAYPFGTEMVYSFGLALDGVTTAKLVNLGFGVLLVLAVYDLGERLFSRRAALAGAVVFGTAPTVIWEATTAYVDLAFAFFVVLALSVAIEHGRSPHRRTAVLCGLLGGLAAATKLTATLAGPGVVLALLLAPTGRPWRQRLSDVLVAAPVAVLLALPWLVRAEILTGNPVFPSLYRLFGADADRWTARSNAGLQGFLDKFGVGQGLEDLVLLPWNLTMSAASFGGSFGLLFLLLVPLALRRRLSRPALLTLSFCLVFALLWFSPVASQQARFLIPAMAAIAPFAGRGLERAAVAVGRHVPAGVATVVGLTAVVSLLSLPPFTERHERGLPGTLTHVVRETPLAYALGSESHDDYLRRRLAPFGADVRLEQAAGPGDRVMTSSDPNNLYSSVEHVPDFAVCLDDVRAASTPEEALDALEADRIRFVLDDLRRPNDYPDALVSTERFRKDHFRLLYRDERSALYEVVP